MVSALKAKRGSRRRSATATATTGNTEEGVSFDGTPKNVDASFARTSADEAHAILEGLRRGLELRDEVVADAEAGNFHRGEFACSGLMQGESKLEWNQPRMGLGSCRFASQGSLAPP